MVTDAASAHEQLPLLADLPQPERGHPGLTGRRNAGGPPARGLPEHTGRPARQRTLLLLLDEGPAGDRALHRLLLAARALRRPGAPRAAPVRRVRPPPRSAAGRTAAPAS